ncbi:sugar phosphate nucleotidyltransferase [Bradyrhizobium sp. RDI18]|uniref:sugar phosphate nucleotidyltransferase n=1 Tax=Bradyrhizobium sp. RDI18 TaxID=3367400 RepID=UPI003712EC48
MPRGLGSRLRPLTETRPKPLLEVLGTPILHNTLGNLAALVPLAQPSDLLRNVA